MRQHPVRLHCRKYMYRRLTDRVLLLLFTATVFRRLLVENQIPAIIAKAILDITTNPYLIWAMIIFFVLLGSMFMEALAAIMILTPVLLPVMYNLGIDPIHFGIVMVCWCEIGLQTPPLGENLFMASGIANLSIEEISLKAVPFSMVAVIAVFIIAYVPRISLWLPRLMGY